MPIGIYKHKPHSVETKLKMSLVKKGKLPKNIEILKNYWKGKKRSEQHKKNLSKSLKGRISPMKGKHHSVETSLKIGLGNKGKKVSEETKKRMSISKTGKLHWNWQDGITLLNKRSYHTTKTPEYKEWRTKNLSRDNFKCKINNQDCKGSLQVHHILNWMDYPELRYDINNGITLCHTHHPKGRVEEKRLIPTFMELVSVSNEYN